MMLNALRDELSYGAVSRREQPVASHIPYARHLNDLVVKTKEGLYLTFLKLDGYSFETADMSEINSRLLARNDLLRSLGNSRYAVYNHIIRREVKPEIDSGFDNALCREIDARYSASLHKRRMFVNDFYLTIVRRDLRGNIGTFEAMFGKFMGKKDNAGGSYTEAMAVTELLDVTKTIEENLGAYGARHLSVVTREGAYFSEPLEFLVQITNGAMPRQMHLPRMALSDALAQKRVFFGKNALEIRGLAKEDSRFAAMISIKEYPSVTGPGFLDVVLAEPHEFILTQSFAIVDKPETLIQIERVRRQVDMSDQAGSIVADQLDTARDELLSSEAIYGEHHMSIMCLGETLEEVTRNVTAVGGALMDRSVIFIREDLDLEPAFWAQLPGNFDYMARKAMISSKNFAGFASLHNYPSGKQDGNHWGPALSVFETTSQTAYFFNLHVRDLGNATVVGPSGSGKTVFLAFLASQSQRIQPRPKLVFIDKDRGAEIFIRAMGGQYEVLRPGEKTGFNPLALPDTPSNRDFLFQLLSYMLQPADKRRLTSAEEMVIRGGIKAVMESGDEGRNLNAFASLLSGRMRAGDDDLRSRLQSWTAHDQRGWLFNNREDKFNVSNIFGFDMTAVLDDPVVRTAALMYLFHRMDELLDGQPTMIFLDEGWRLLDDEVFAQFIKDKLKTIRKQNGVIVFGTQSAADIVNSKSANTLIEQTPTNIFFPNPKADDASYKGAFRLSQREVNWIRGSIPEQRQFLIKHGNDSVIAKLNLNGMSDIIKILSGRTETVAELDRLRAVHGDDPNNWLAAFLESERPQ